MRGAGSRWSPRGKVFVATGVGTQGQGHMTTFAQIVAEVLRVAPRDVSVRTGDTAAFGWGTGTFASRAAVVAGTAVSLAAQAVREKTRLVAASLLEARPDEIELEHGQAFVRGAPARSLSLGDVAAASNPLRFAMPADWEGPGLEATRYFAPPRGTFSNGVHACIVEVDPETGMLRVRRYVVVHDCGRVLNPLILDGQIHGGVAQGLGGAMWEKLVYDAQGQPLATTLMDYLLPTSAEVPPLEVEHEETPTPLNPLGVKGVGEGGAIAPPVALANAICDALAPFKIELNRLPLKPEQIRAALG